MWFVSSRGVSVPIHGMNGEGLSVLSSHAHDVIEGRERFSVSPSVCLPADLMGSDRYVSRLLIEVLSVVARKKVIGINHSFVFSVLLLDLAKLVICCFVWTGVFNAPGLVACPVTTDSIIAWTNKMTS